MKVGRGHALYALAQGDWPLGGEAGSPAAPNTGQLFRVGRHGSLELIADGLNQPVSFQLIRGTPTSRSAGRWVDLHGHGH